MLCMCKLEVCRLTGFTEFITLTNGACLVVATPVALHSDLKRKRYIARDWFGLETR
jgi:hypothetical protein